MRSCRLLLVVAGVSAILGCATQQGAEMLDGATTVPQSTAEYNVANDPRIQDLTAEQIDWTASQAWMRYGVNQISMRLLYFGLTEYHYHPALLRAMGDLFVEDYPAAAAPVFYYLKHTDVVLTTDQQEKTDLMYASAMSLWGLSRKRDGTPVKLGDFFEPELFDYDVEGLRSFVQPLVDAAGSLEAVLDGLHTMLGLATGFVAGEWDGMIYDLFDAAKFTLRAGYYEWIELSTKDELGELLILEQGLPK